MALGLKTGTSPTKNDNLVHSNVLYKQQFKNHNILDRKGGRNSRAHTISPDRDSNLYKGSSNEVENDILDSLRRNLREMDLVNPPENKRAPTYLLVKNKKKRSHSENRNRQLDSPVNKDEAQFYTSKLKSTLKMPTDTLDQVLFFSKRKANQHLNSSKGFQMVEDSFKLQKSLSEKKPSSGLQPLRSTPRDETSHEGYFGSEI